MAFPYDRFINFEDGTDGVFDSETDTGNRLSVAHYTELTPHLNAAPYRGAYCALVDFDISASDSYFVDTDNFALDATSNFAFKIFLSDNLTLANDAEFSVFNLTASGTSQLTIMVGRTTAGDTSSRFYIGAGKASTAAAQRLDISQGVWHHVDFTFNIDAGCGNDGDVILRLDESIAATLSTIDQIATTDIRFGADASDAGWTSPTVGFMLLDDLYEDSDRIRDSRNRYQNRIVMEQDGHAFVGPGWVDSIEFAPDIGSSDQSVEFYDTDDANTVALHGNRIRRMFQETSLATVLQNDLPFYVHRGLYVDFTGTAAADGPFAYIHCRPKYWSDANVRLYAKKRPNLANA